MTNLPTAHGLPTPRDRRGSLTKRLKQGPQLSPEAGDCHSLASGSCSSAGSQPQPPQPQPPLAEEQDEGAAGSLAELSIGAFLHAVGGNCSRPGFAPSEPIAEDAAPQALTAASKAPPLAPRPAQNAPGKTRLAQLAGEGGGGKTQRTKAAVTKVTNLPTAHGLPTPRDRRGSLSSKRPKQRDAKDAVYV